MSSKKPHLLKLPTGPCHKKSNIFIISRLAVFTAVLHYVYRRKTRREFTRPPCLSEISSVFIVNYTFGFFRFVVSFCFVPLFSCGATSGWFAVLKYFESVLCIDVIPRFPELSYFVRGICLSVILLMYVYRSLLHQHAGLSQ